jgi:hypothetical protein
VIQRQNADLTALDDAAGDGAANLPARRAEAEADGSGAANAPARIIARIGDVIQSVLAGTISSRQRVLPSANVHRAIADVNTENVLGNAVSNDLQTCMRMNHNAWQHTLMHYNLSLCFRGICSRQHAAAPRQERDSRESPQSWI